MKTIFLTVYDGDTEKVILQTGVLARLVEEGNRVVLLVRGPDRLTYYQEVYAGEHVHIEELPYAMTRAERVWYHLGWNTLPTRSAEVRRRQRYAQHRSLFRYLLERIAGVLGHFRTWRELLRLMYRYSPDRYCDDLFKKYHPDLVFTQNMFSAEDMRMLRQAKRHGVKTIATAKSWDVLTTKAFTRVKADVLLVFNEINKQEAIALGDYKVEQVTVTGFPQFDVYARDEWKLSREEFCATSGLDPKKRIVLYALPGDWKTPYTKDILKALDTAIEEKRFSKPLQVFGRPHPKYPDASEKEKFNNVVIKRPGTYFSPNREVSIDMAVADSYQFTFTSKDIAFLANSLYHSDLVINTESTLTLDAAALGRPTVLIGYDGGHTVPYDQSIARVYEREHYRHVLDTKANPLVQSDEELFKEVETFLENSNYLFAERAKLEKELLYKVDGKSAERIAHAILELLAQ